MSLPWMYQLGLMRPKDNLPRIAVPHGVRPFQACFFMLAGIVFDFVGGMLWNDTLEREPPPPSDINDWSDEQIVNAWKNAEPHPDVPPHHYCNVRVIASNTIVKETELEWDDEFGWPDLGSEAHMLQLIHKQTQIAPPFYRYIRRHEINISEGVPEDLKRDLVATQFLQGGKRLSDCWESLSIWTKLRVAWTLRQFLCQLRGVSSVYSERPGPIGGDSPIFPRGAMFPRGFPATSTSTDLVEYFNNIIRGSEAIGNYRGVPQLRPPSPLVLTHADLHMGNILLDSQGRVWITDWGHSGYYPIWFEYIIAVHMADHQKAPDSWRLLLPVIAQPYIAYQSWAERMLIIPRVATGLDVIWPYIMGQIHCFRERALSIVGYSG